MKSIGQLLRREIGLDEASVGSSLIERTIRLRMKALGLQALGQYRDLLAASRSEWEELIEAVVVTETWFFRDPEAFSALAQLVQRELLAAGARAPVRILSLPCSTGEEPYSLAMALLDAGVPPARFETDAVDLSARALERAQRAVYGKNSFRGPALGPCASGGTGAAGSGPPDHMGRAYRDRHFTPAGAGFQLHERVRECVTFERGNLLAPEFLARRAPYDVIFCRNLLIYFGRATQTQALHQLHRLLAPRGVLFVGPAELTLVTEHGFAPLGFPMAFASRKVGAEPARPALRSGPARGLVSVAPPSAPASGQARPTALRVGAVNSLRREPFATDGVASSDLGAGVSALAAGPHTPAPRPQHPDPSYDLNQARALADAGRLAEAIEICEAHVQAVGPSAQAYYLIGLARDADGDPAALDYYRKALYLEPNHYETLLQISLLLEKQGDAIGARPFKRRAQRLRRSGGRLNYEG